MFKTILSWFQRIKIPKWIKDLFSDIWNDVIYPALKQLGQEIINYLIGQIIAQSKLDIKGSEKLKNVSNAFRQKYPTEQIADKILNAVINNLVADLSVKNVIL